MMHNYFTFLAFYGVYYVKSYNFDFAFTPRHLTRGVVYALTNNVAFSLVAGMNCNAALFHTFHYSLDPRQSLLCRKLPSLRERNSQGRYIVRCDPTNYPSELVCPL